MMESNGRRNGQMAGMAGMVERRKECQNSRMAEMATDGMVKWWEWSNGGNGGWNCRIETQEYLGKIGIFLLLKSNFPCSKFDFLQGLSDFQEIRKNLLRRLSDFFDANFYFP
jgi:hypothetical protein